MYRLGQALVGARLDRRRAMVHTLYRLGQALVGARLDRRRAIVHALRSGVSLSLGILAEWGAESAEEVPLDAQNLGFRVRVQGSGF
jgi:hypothetical protein